MAKILMVDDEPDLVRLLKPHILREGHRFHHAGTAEDGLKSVRRYAPDLILLDVRLPRMDGLDLIRILRREVSVPIILLTGKTAEFDRVLGLKLGADDYVTKPFSVPELLARIQTILQRAHGRREGSPVRFGGLEVDIERHEVRVNGRYRELAPREFQILQLLIESDGKALSRASLLESLWGLDHGHEVSTRTVDQHVARLRGKLLGEKARIITVKNVGYRLKVD